MFEEIGLMFTVRYLDKEKEPMGTNHCNYNSFALLFMNKVQNLYV